MISEDVCKEDCRKFYVPEPKMTCPNGHTGRVYHVRTGKLNKDWYECETCLIQWGGTDEG